MIAECIRYWTTFAPERVRKYGYLKRLTALEFRERRCRAAWGPHLARTRQFILKAADLVPQPGTAVIVGSGLLLDDPVKPPCYGPLACRVSGTGGLILSS